MPQGWLIDEGASRQMREARQLQLRPTAEQITAFEARDHVSALSQEQPLPRIMKVAGSTAQISVEGVLTKSPDIMAYFFGGGNTTYRAIQASLAIAQSDPAIKQIVMYVDSPGGEVDGLFETLAAIEQTRGAKSMSVKAGNAMSAAYGLAAAAGKIEAMSPGTRIGSVGVVATYFTDDDIVNVTNTDSPDKRPDPKTEEGKAVIRRELDAMHELFVDAIARGRGTDANDVRENFGRGATLLAGEAKKRGMIDAVAKPGPRAVGTANTIGASADDRKKEQKPMDLEAFKAQHPDLFKAAKAEGHTEGCAAERDRVCAHLELGSVGGSEGMDVAVAAIRGGEGLTLTASAKYQRIALNQRDRDLRQTDDRSIAGAADGATRPGGSAAGTTPNNPGANGEQPEDIGMQVARRMMERRGKKVA